MRNDDTEFWTEEQDVAADAPQEDPYPEDAFRYEDEEETGKKKRAKSKKERAMEKADKAAKSGADLEAAKNKEKKTMVVLRVLLCVAVVGVIGYLNYPRILTAMEMRGNAAVYVEEHNIAPTPTPDPFGGGEITEYKYIDVERMENMAAEDVAAWYKEHFPDDKPFNKAALSEYNYWLTDKLKDPSFKKAYYDALNEKTLATSELDGMSYEELAAWYKERYTAPEDLKAAALEHDEFMEWLREKAKTDADLVAEFKRIIFDEMGETALNNPFVLPPNDDGDTPPASDSDLTVPEEAEGETPEEEKAEAAIAPVAEVAAPTKADPWGTGTTAWGGTGATEAPAPTPTPTPVVAWTPPAEDPIPVPDLPAEELPEAEPEPVAENPTAAEPAGEGEGADISDGTES